MKVSWGFKDETADSVNTEPGSALYGVRARIHTVCPQLGSATAPQVGSPMPQPAGASSPHAPGAPLLPLGLGPWVPPQDSQGAACKHPGTPRDGAGVM